MARIGDERTYVLTAAGRDALENEDVCDCVIQRDAGMIVCHKCDTIYGLLRPELWSYSFGSRSDKPA
jgi:hypothetical protein